MKEKMVRCGLIGYNWKFTQADYLDNIHASEEMATLHGNGA